MISSDNKTKECTDLDQRAKNQLFFHNPFITSARGL
jgi:hypothetical protein